MSWLQYSAIENEEGSVAKQYETINMKVISLLCHLHFYQWLYKFILHALIYNRLGECNINLGKLGTCLNEVVATQTEAGLTAYNFTFFVATFIVGEY